MTHGDPGIGEPGRRAGPATSERDPAGAVFEALADPMRRRLLQTISASPSTATELAGALPISRQAVAKHLIALSHAGLLDRERSGRDVRYHVTPAPLSEAVSWIADVGGQWDERLGRLAALSEPGTGPIPTQH
jgi:DNA-binding transcriptional ArsR family regulator